MQKRLFLSAILLAVGLSVAAMSTLDSLFTMLDADMAQSARFRELHEQCIDSLKAVRPMTKALQVRIAREYQYYQSDSAHVWYLRLINDEEPYRTQAYIGLVQLTSSIGKYGDGIALIPLAGEIPDSLRVDWIEAVWRIHNEAMAASTTPQLREQLAASVRLYYDSLLHEMDRQAPGNTAIRLRRNILAAIDADNIPRALQINDSILARVPVWSHRYAIEAYNRATLYERLGKEREYLEWLTRSAIADVRCGIMDNGSSWLVAKECYASGDLERAFRYSDYSLTNASFFNAPTRFIQTYSLGHEIANSYEQQLHQSSVRLTIALVALAIVAVIMVIGVFFSLRQNRRLHAMNREITTMNEELRAINRQLKETDKVKEQYICRYLEVYSDYIRRLTTMARKAGEKDPAGFMDREMDNFYRSFDDTFLSLYGTFVDDFNALVKPEARLAPKPGERMTIEMRIFALILLGITSSAKIAELLCYSPNTISNYRVKMKNASLGDRESFEQRIREIGRK
ncbi:MAG: hypothetical protein II551_00400 [Paludibacteraceae bacterium]|nr:hypothetical protein [Paludibacteraceae bacterium]